MKGPPAFLCRQTTILLLLSLTLPSTFVVSQTAREEANSVGIVGVSITYGNKNNKNKPKTTLFPTHEFGIDEETGNRTTTYFDEPDYLDTIDVKTITVIDFNDYPLRYVEYEQDPINITAIENVAGARQADEPAEEENVVNPDRSGCVRPNLLMRAGKRRVEVVKYNTICEEIATSYYGEGTERWTVKYQYSCPKNGKNADKIVGKYQLCDDTSCNNCTDIRGDGGELIQTYDQYDPDEVTIDSCLEWDYADPSLGTGYQMYMFRQDPTTINNIDLYSKVVLANTCMGKKFVSKTTTTATKNNGNNKDKEEAKDKVKDDAKEKEETKDKVQQFTMGKEEVKTEAKDKVKEDAKEKAEEAQAKKDKVKEDAKDKADEAKEKAKDKAEKVKAEAKDKAKAKAEAKDKAKDKATEKVKDAAEAMMDDRRKLSSLLSLETSQTQQQHQLIRRRRSV